MFKMENAMEFFEMMSKNQKANKKIMYKHLNEYAIKGETLFVGSSLQENFPINEMAQSLGYHGVIYNRGIGGYVTTELLDSMEECIFELEPSRLFINIGTNDIGSPDYVPEKLIERYDQILMQIKDRLPNCKVYVMAYYPINADADFGIPKEQKENMYKTRTNSAILNANQLVEKLAEKFEYEYINVNEGLQDSQGNLKAEFAIEGLHMWPNAYKVIFENLKKYL